MREQPVTGAQIDDPPAAEQPARPPCHLPGLVQLLARQTTCRTHGAADAVEQCVGRKPSEIVLGQAAAGSGENATSSLL